MDDGMPYGRIQGQGHSREVDRQSPTGLIFYFYIHNFSISSPEKISKPFYALNSFKCCMFSVDGDADAAVTGRILNGCFKLGLWRLSSLTA